MKMDLIEDAVSLSQIKKIDGIAPKGGGATGVADLKHSGKTSFVDFLGHKVNELNHLGLEADQKLQDALTGKEVNPHATLIAMQKADISFRLMMSVQQRLIQAYRQVIRMPIG